MIEIKYSRYFPFVKKDPFVFGSPWFDYDLIEQRPDIKISRIKSILFEGFFSYRNKDIVLHGVDPFNFNEIKTENVGFDSLQAATGSRQLVKNDTVIIPMIHPGASIYGHWLIDLIPIIRVFEYIFPLKKFAIGMPDDAPTYASTIIKQLCGDNVDIVFINNSIGYHGSLFFCSPLRYHDYLSEFCVPNNYTSLCSSRRVYVGRKNFSSYRVLINSAEVEALFASRGFEVVYPEELSIDDQVTLFESAGIVAGEAGSGLHNSIFCSSKVKIVNIQSSRQNHLIQASLCNWLNQECIYLVGQSIDDDWNSDFLVSISDVNRVIEFIES